MSAADGAYPMPYWRALIPIGIALALWWLGINPLDRLGGLVPAGGPEEGAQARASINDCRPTAAEMAATEVAGTLDGAATPSPVPHPIVTTELVVLAGDRDVPRLLPSLVFRAPAEEHADLNAFLSASLSAIESEATLDVNQRLDQQSSYRTLLAELLANDLTDEGDLGLFTAPAEARLNEVLLIGEPPIVGLGANGTVTLIVPKVPEVLADTSIEADDAAGPSSFINPVDEGIVGDTRDALAGGWEIATRGRNIHFTITGRPPANTAWDVRVCAEGLDIVAAALTALETPVSPAALSIMTAPATPSPVATAATPVATPLAQADTGSPETSSLPRPQYQNVNSVRWLIQADPEMPDLEIEVVAQASALMAARNWLLSDWRRTLATVLAYTIPALLLGIGLKLVPRDGARSSNRQAVRDQLSAVAWAVVRLTIAAILSFIVFVSPIQGAMQIPAEWVPTGYPLLAIIACAVVGLGLLGERRIWWRAGPRRVEETRSAEAAIVTGAIAMPDAGPVAPSAAATEHRPADKPRPEWFVASPGVELALGLIAAAAVGACLAYLENRWGCLIPGICGSIGDWDFVVRNQVTPALIAASCSMFLVTAIQVWLWRSDPDHGSWPIMTLPAVGALSLLLCVLRLEVHALTGRTGQVWLAVDGGLIPVWVTACVVVGLLLFVAGLVPEEIVRLVPERVRRIVRPTHWGLAAALILVAIMLQWMWAIYSQESIWWRALVEADLEGRLPAIFSARLYEPLTQYPFSFFPSLGELLVALGLVGFVGLLGAPGPGHSARSLAKEDGWVRWVLAGLFAIFVTGYGGQILGLRAPVAFLLGLVLLPLAWSYPDPVAPDNVEGDGGGDENPRVMASRGDPPPHGMTHDGSRQQANAGAGGEVEEGDQAEANQPVGVASHPGAAEHTTGTGAAAASSGAAAPETTDKGDALSAKEMARRSEVLAHGPNQGWWENGVLAVQLGSRLALLPIAYFMFVFLGSQGEGGWSLSTPFAVTGFVSVLVNEVAFWLVAAFVLGCLFPHLIGPNGLVKGATLAAVYVAANAGAALLGIPGNALWQVRSFQLLLFLMLLGAWIDHIALGEPRVALKKIFGRYDLPNMTSTVLTQILPLLAALIGVVIQLANNQTHEATTSLVSGEARVALENFLASGPSTR